MPKNTKTQSFICLFQSVNQCGEIAVLLIDAPSREAAGRLACHGHANDSTAKVFTPSEYARFVAKKRKLARPCDYFDGTGAIIVSLHSNDRKEFYPDNSIQDASDDDATTGCVLPSGLADQADGELACVYPYNFRFSQATGWMFGEINKIAADLYAAGQILSLLRDERGRWAVMIRPKNDDGAEVTGDESTTGEYVHVDKLLIEVKRVQAKQALLGS